MTGAVSSGFALKMENQALDEFTREQQNDFIDYEKELYKLIVIVGNQYENKFKDDELDISFNDIVYSENKNDTLDGYVKAIDLGLRSPSEILANEKNISIDDAKILLENNIIERNKLYNKISDNINTLETVNKL